MTRLDAMIVYNPNRDIVEDRKYITDYSIDQVQTTLTRTRLVIAMIDYIVTCDTFVFYFYYPRFSKTCWVFMHIFIHYFEMRLLISYVIIAFIWLVLAWSEPWERNISPFLKKTFFS